MKERLAGLDLLRGVCALGVATYHFSSWLNLNFVSLNVGYYAVYVFFIISGASMYISYVNRISNFEDFKHFIFIRYFRLFPLFFLVLLIGPVAQSYDFSAYNSDFWRKAALNLTFLFGIGNPGINSLVTGGWSLGVEFVFYMFFPVFLLFFAGKKCPIVSLLVLQAIFVNMSASNNDWGVYIQPLAFVWYFAVGCFVGNYFLSNRHFFSGRARYFGVVVSLFILIFWLVNKPSNMAETLTGPPSIFMPVMCAILVGAFLAFSGGRVSLLLGKVSYGAYLLHPIVFYCVERHAVGFSVFGRLFLFLAVTIILSYFFDKYFEQPILDWAKQRFPVGRKIGADTK